MAASVLQAERHLLLLGSGRNRPLLRMLPPRVLFPHRRRSWPRAVRVSPGDGEGAGGFASAVEKRSIPGIVEEEGHGARGEELEGDVAGALEQRWPPWDGLAERYKLIGATSLAFVICNMDKVNLSVAIIPMSHQYGWNSSTAGLVQSSFFWGYALSQLPGGWLAKLFGGRKVLEVGVVTWSLATAIIPVVAGFMPGLVLSRILVGIGEGVSPSAATDLIARQDHILVWSIPWQERSRAVAVVFGGLSFGSVLGLLFAPPIIQNFGWESVFYIFGLLGIVWCLGFESLIVQRFGDKKSLLNLGQSSTGSDGLISYAMSSESSHSSLEDLQNSLKVVFCQSRSGCIIFSGISEELNLNLTEAAWVSVLPPLGSMIITSIAAPFADNLISNGVDTTKVRKICQTIAFVSPATFMMLSSVDLGLPPWEIVAFLTSGVALSSFALSGHVGFIAHIKTSLVNMQAFSWSIMSDCYLFVFFMFQGITNTVGAVPGIVGVALTGFLLDSTHSWSISLFAPSIFFYLTGTVVWLAFASSKPQDFSKSGPESEP
ncbi:putative anion transporter 6, chloroplastic [Zea mays]|uniref:Putative anion transporter 6, chloroplastic n=1 Tax=Zea mays TaxID=4577 RepID=A0A3L6DZA8_MAIZE|nr:putative anion transporter 6, chloroplastic [Zea mays]